MSKWSTAWNRDWWTKGRGTTIALIMVTALIGFEVFNFDTTRFALMDLMSGHRFLGIEWAAILAFAFCSIDFAGVVRMFTPQQSLQDEPREVWLLLGAWFLGAGMNAVMTWYAVALVMAPRSVGASQISHDAMLFYAPIFVAVLVWLTRLLLIGSSSVAADRLMHNRGYTTNTNRPRRAPLRDPAYNRSRANGEENFQEDYFGD